MQTTKVAAFGHNYVTTPLLGFGDYDNSADVERANVLFTLRTATNCWHGEVAYSSDHVIEFNVPDAHSIQDASESLRILRTGRNPEHHGWNKSDVVRDWPNPDKPPVVIHYVHVHGEAVYIREDIATEHGILEALQEYALLDDDSQYEVEAIIQDSSWSSYIYTDLSASVVKYIAKGDDQRAGHLIDEDQDLLVEEQHLKAALWEHLKRTGNYGHIENTTWVPPHLTEEITARSIVNILLEDDNQQQLPLQQDSQQ